MYTYPAGPRITPEFKVFLLYSGCNSYTIIIGKDLSWLDGKIRNNQLVIYDDTCMEWGNN